MICMALGCHNEDSAAFTEDGVRVCRECAAHYEALGYAIAWLRAPRLRSTDVEDAWSRVACAEAMRSLGNNLAVAVALGYGHELGRGSFELNHPGWYPGCGFEATRTTIACEWCGNVFPADSVKSKQADRCAASAWWRKDDAAWLVQGHYGSRKHDMNLYRVTACSLISSMAYVVEDRRDMVIDPLCDDCLDAWLAEGGMVLIEEHVL